MKKIGVCISGWLLAGGVLFAQGEMDAFRFSGLDLNGTARSVSMGGAFGALGGDMSAMSHNPAGIGVYRSSEVQTTLNLHASNMKSDWTGLKTNDNKTRFNFDNFSYISYFPTGNDQGIKGWNIGFSYNRIKNFSRNYKAIGNPQFSMADFTAAFASNTNELGEDRGTYLSELNDKYPYKNNPWLSVLGYQSGFFAPNDDSNPKNDVYHNAFGGKPNETSVRIREKGSINEYNFSVATNISDIVFLGATMAITDIDYRMSSYHDEKFTGSDYLYLDNFLETEGTAYSLNLGAIVRPIDQLRLGVAYNSPKWYRMSDYFYAEGGSRIASYVDQPELKANTPNDAAPAEYNLRTPDRWIFSIAGILGNTALISMDYELTNYSSMQLSDRDWDQTTFANHNRYIRDDFKKGHTLKFGTEVKVTPQFAIRGGYVWQPSPMNKTLTSSNHDELNMIFPIGTVPHYKVSNETNYFTVGLGYRFTPNFYMDLGCVYRVENQKLYPFSKTIWNHPDLGIKPIVSEPAKISAQTTRVVLSMGYKF